MGCGGSKGAPAYALELPPAQLEAAVAGMRGAAGAAAGRGAVLHMARGRSEFMMRDIIGKGGKSVGVQIGFHPATHAYYALKFISEARAAAEGWEVQPTDELEAMRAATAAGCPFVTPLRGWFEEPAPREGGLTLALVMGYMPGGELFSRMCGRRMGADEAAFYAAEVVCALEGLHALGFIYRCVRACAHACVRACVCAYGRAGRRVGWRVAHPHPPPGTPPPPPPLRRCSDLKPENILLDAEGHLALCDMGFATRVPTAYKRLGCVSRGVGGSPGWGPRRAQHTRRLSALHVAPPPALATRDAAHTHTCSPYTTTPLFPTVRTGRPSTRRPRYSAPTWPRTATRAPWTGGRWAACCLR